MSLRSQVTLALASLIAMSWSVATFADNLEANSLESGTARLVTFEKATGETCFALSLSARSNR